MSYSGALKLLDNTYFIPSFNDIDTMHKNVSELLNPGDKFEIAHAINFKGTNTKNI